MYCMYILFTILASAVAPQAIAVENPSVSELLDKYAVTQDKLRSSFIGKIEVSTKFEGVNRGRPSMKRGQVYEMNRKIELRSDGNRCYAYQKIWGRRSIGNTSEEEAYVSIRLWDDETFYHYGISPLSRTNKNGTVTLSYPKNFNHMRWWQAAPGRTIRGYFPGVDERIDTELRQATTISVQPQREDINGSQCYVINARTKGTKGTKGCEFRIWIDPEHDYNIAKAIVKRGWASWNRPERRPKAPKGNAEVELRNVRFKKIDDVWLPVEADYRREREDVTGDYEKDFIHLKMTEFVMNPDHDALGSFKHDFIPNGARVRLAGVPGITYTWQDGELIPNIDEAVIDEIDKMAETIRTKSTIAPMGATVSELLKKYAETQDKLRSFIAKGESTIEYIKIPRQSGRMQKELCEFRTDGDRVNHRGSVWGKLLSKDNALYKFFLWDGESFIQYRQGSQLTGSAGFIEKNDDSKKRLIATEYKGAPLMGICGGDYDRIDSILRKADNISLRQKTEQVGNSQCYVIDAVTKRGKYMVWIDPEHGYNIAKIELQKRKGDLIGSSERVKIGVLFLLKNVRFEKTDDVWVPVEADMKQYQDDHISIIKWHHKRTKMTLNPDHNALGSFVPDDIPEGTKEKLLTATY